MLAIVSPAKKLDFSELEDSITHTQADFLNRSAILVDQAKKLSKRELANLMKISDKLADLNYQRFRAYSTPFNLSNSKQAVLAFSGDTYMGLDAKSLTEDDLIYAQDHLRILSGLYGILRPLDLIQPYRLEMSSRLKNPKGSDLYDFWGYDLSEAIDKIVSSHKEEIVINLASNEYFKALRTDSMQSKIITPVFKEVKGGVAKVLGLFAKRARGSMARYLIKHRIEKKEDLKEFSDGGYAFQPSISDDETWIFTRKI